MSSMGSEDIRRGFRDPATMLRVRTQVDESAGETTRYSISLL
jgi:hypothetical protein